MQILNRGIPSRIGCRTVAREPVCDLLATGCSEVVVDCFQARNCIPAALLIRDSWAAEVADRIEAPPSWHRLNSCRPLEKVIAGIVFGDGRECPEIAGRVAQPGQIWLSTA